MTNLIQKYCDLGKQYLIEKDYTSADYQYQKALLLDPNSLKAILGLASVKFAQKKYQAAKQLCQKCLKIDPNQYKVYYSMGIMQNSQGKKLQAKKYFQKALQLNYKFPKVYINLGYIELLSQNLPKAEIYYLKATQLEENNVKAYLGLGLIYQKMKKYQQAQKYLLRALKQKQDSQTIHLRLGIVYHQMNNTQKAKQHYRRCIQLDKYQTGKAYYNLAVIKVSQENNYGQGLNLIDKAISKQNNNILYLMAKVQLLYKLQYQKQAVQSLQIIRNIIKNLSMAQIKRIYGIGEQVVNWINVQSKQLNKPQNKQKKQKITKQNLKIVEQSPEPSAEQFIKYQDNIDLKSKRINSQTLRCQLQKQLGIQIKYLNLLKQHKLTQYSQYFTHIFYALFYTFSTLKLIHSDVSHPNSFANTYTKDINDKLLKLFKMDREQSKMLIQEMFNGILFCCMLKFKKQYGFIQVMRQLIGNIQNQNQLIKCIDQLLQLIINTKQLINMLQNCNDKQQKLKLIHIGKRINQTKIQKQQQQTRIKTVQILSNLAKVDVSQHARMALNHCISLIMVFMKPQNQQIVKQFYNPLFAAGLIWIKQVHQAIVMEQK